jgi:hypothetical protein
VHRSVVFGAMLVSQTTDETWTVPVVRLTVVFAELPL